MIRYHDGIGPGGEPQAGVFGVEHSLENEFAGPAAPDPLHIAPIGRRIELRGGPLRKSANCAGAADASRQIAESAPFAEQHLERPVGFRSHVQDIAQREPRRNREPVARIAAPLPQGLQIEREHERRTLRGGRAIDEFLIEAAILHEILLKPEGLLGRCSNILDRANGHGAHAIRNAARSRGAGREYLAVRVEQAGEPGRADRQGHRDGCAHQRRGKRHVRHIHHDPLAKGHRIEVGGVALKRPFIVGAARGIVEDGAWNALLRKLAQIIDAEDGGHGRARSARQ
jgi:hypothetical protein